MQALGARELVMDPIRGSHLGRRPMRRLYVGRTHASRRLVADSSNKTLAPRGPSTHAGLDQRSCDGPVFRAVVVAGEECVLARESLWAHGAFDDVGIEIDATVVEEAGQAFPVFERITDGLSDGGFD